MSDTTIDVQVIEPDGDVGQMIEDHLSRAIHLHLERACVNICRAGSADQAMDQFLARPADVIITELELPDSDGISMLAELRAHAEFSAIVVARQATLGKAVELMRLGVRDLLIKPCDLRRLGKVAAVAAADRLAAKRAELRQRRLRTVAGRIIRDRRELRRRMDLVCSDLVSAYRDLASRFVEHAAGSKTHEN